MSVGGEALIYNCHPLEHADAPVYSHLVPVPGVKHAASSGKKYSRSISSCVPSSSYEALRYAVAALNRLDDFNCEKIGAGFFSEVFKVTHRVTGQVMVLKMNTSLSNRPNMLREVQLMNRLSHHNILRFMGVCVHEGQLHALTEYINGGSLEQLLQNKLIDLPWETRIKLALDIARGMTYLHSRGVFHRDLTSKNVLIKMNNDGMTAVIGDFGLAEKIPDSRDRSQRLPIVGSPYWMAPECLHGKWYNEKADVFSYGIILCEIIARIEADPDILPRTENFGVDYVTFSDMCPDCPPQFLEIAFSSCRIDPDSRPNFKEIVLQLESFLNLISSMSGGSNCFYPPIIYSPCRDDGDSIDSVRAIFAHGWSRFVATQSKMETKVCQTPAKLLSPAQPSPVTPKHIGEAMSMQDPHYKPNSGSQNPFASLPRFWKGKKFLEMSVSDIDLAHSVNLSLMSPKCSPSPPPGTPVSQGKFSTLTVCHNSSRKMSKSLPTSPVLQRKSKTKYLNSSALEVPDSPRSVSPGPSFSPSSSLSPFEPDESFSGYSSVQEQMSDCKLEDTCSQFQEVDKMRLSAAILPEPSAVVHFRTKTPSLCAKLRRLSGESGFFSVGDRNSNCDLSLESYHNQDDLSSWTTDSSAESHLNDSPSDTDENGQNNGCGRKRPSSFYSDDSCCCCVNSSHNCCDITLNSQVESEGSVAVPYINLPNTEKTKAQSVVPEFCYSCHLCSSVCSCNAKGLCLLKEISSQTENNRTDEPSLMLNLENHLLRHGTNGQSKKCEKENRIIKCMRTSEV